MVWWHSSTAVNFWHDSIATTNSFLAFACVSFRFHFSDAQSLLIILSCPTDVFSSNHTHFYAQFYLLGLESQLYFHAGLILVQFSRSTQVVLQYISSNLSFSFLTKSFIVGGWRTLGPQSFIFVIFNSCIINSCCGEPKIWWRCANSAIESGIICVPFRITVVI